MNISSMLNIHQGPYVIELQVLIVLGIVANTQVLDFRV